MSKEFFKNRRNDPSGKNKHVSADLFYRSLFKYNPDMALFMDVHGTIAKVNEGLASSLGYTMSDIELNTLDKFLPSHELSSYEEQFKETLQGNTPSISTRLLHKDGSSIDITLNLIPATNDEKIIGVFGIAKDITEIKEYERELAESEKKFRTLADESLIGIYLVREDGKIIYGNEEFYELLGMKNNDMEIDFLKFVHPEDAADFHARRQEIIDTEKGLTHTYRIIQRDGTTLHVESHPELIYLDNEKFLSGTIQDITERKKAAELNEYFAYHDYLTGLPNDRYFYKKLEKELINSAKRKQPLTIMLLDLDRFKYINDSVGHSIGDKLLQEVAKRLKTELDSNEFLARDGGDEFSMLLPATGSTEQVMDRAKSIIKALEKPFYIDKYELFITASIGISIFPNDGEDTETLIKHADSALYKAKGKSKNTFQIFTTSMNEEAYKIFSLEADLRKAIDLNELELYYQPQVRTGTSEIVGAEALIRWNHPEWGVVFPNEFLPIAEETGLIFEMNKWIKKTAATQTKFWQKAGLPPVPVSINLSAHRFLEKDLTENIKTVLEETDLAPEYFQIEIVESDILENEKVVSATLDELKRMGVKVSLDDFGTGYSSLSYLRKFKGKIDTLKIDRSFIKDVSTTDGEDANFITKTIIELAQHLNMDIVAEGVETTEQLEFLRKSKCDTIQGFLFSKPVPAEEFARLLEKGFPKM